MSPGYADCVRRRRRRRRRFRTATELVILIPAVRVPVGRVSGRARAHSAAELGAPARPLARVRRADGRERRRRARGERTGDTARADLLRPPARPAFEYRGGKYVIKFRSRFARRRRGPGRCSAKRIISRGAYKKRTRTIVFPADPARRQVTVRVCDSHKGTAKLLHFTS